MSSSDSLTDLMDALGVMRARLHALKSGEPTLCAASLSLLPAEPAEPAEPCGPALPGPRGASDALNTP